MSLIERTVPPRVADKAQSVVAELLAAPRLQFEVLLNSWRRGMEILWHCPAEQTQKVFDLLGADAMELFAISNKTVEFLENLRPGCTVSTLAMMRSYSIVDGRIIIHAD